MKRKANIDTIIIHCTATGPGREVSVTELNRWHQAQRFEPYVTPEGRKIFAGYHYLIHIDGTVKVIRPEEHRGQHCPQQNMNNRGIGICYVGGVDNNNKPCDTRTEPQKLALIRLLKELRTHYPSAAIIGHRDVQGVAKACPSFDAKYEYSKI